MLVAVCKKYVLFFNFFVLTYNDTELMPEMVLVSWQGLIRPTGQIFEGSCTVFILLIHNLYNNGQLLLQIVCYLNNCRIILLIVIPYLGLFCQTIFKVRNELQSFRGCILMSGPQMVCALHLSMPCCILSRVNAEFL